jgi:hypothetical protein
MEVVMNYSEKLKDPRWQKKRLEILQRDEWKCSYCEDEKTMLQVHHLRYKLHAQPWDYDNQDLITLCKPCHEMETAYRDKADMALLDILRRRCFSAQEIDLLSSYIDECPELLKQTVVEHEFKKVQAFVKEQRMVKK